MVRVYLDVETYRPRKEDAFINEKVIAIGVLEDWTPYRESSLQPSPSSIEYRVIAEWRLGSEREIIFELYSYLYRLISMVKRKEVKFLEIVGFNILRFDIPLLIQKGLVYGIGGIDQLNKLWHDTHTRDLFQATLPLRNMLFKGHSLEGIAEKARECGLNVPEPYGKGENIARWYEDGKYDEIERHLRRDLEVVRALDLQMGKLLRCYYSVS